MMDKQKAAETILEVLKAGAMVEPNKEEVWRAALLAGLAEVERLEALTEPAERIYEALSDEERLYDALNTVKECCASQGFDCHVCPLNISGGCLIGQVDETPEDWDLEFLKGR